jgi:hypothetical protein
MSTQARAIALLSMAAFLASPPPPLQYPHAVVLSRPLSFHNRVLLNRAAVAGLRTIEVMIAAAPDGFEAARALVTRSGGQVGFSRSDVGYLRAAIPIDTATAIASDPSVEALQIASLSRGAWHHDVRTRRNAEALRAIEASSDRGANLGPTTSHLPVLTAEEARSVGFTGDADTGVDAWLRQHPAYDGRGVTIALLETAQIQFDHPAFATATTIDGRAVPKLAGILNAIGPESPDETRVVLDVEIDAVGTWKRIGERTYILPGPGSFRFGVFSLAAGDHLVHRFAVLMRPASAEIWVDTDGDADFGDERPMADVNDRVDIGTLRLLHPRPTTLAFVVARGPRPHTVHVYVARDDHNTMVASVAAGSRMEDGLAKGVAPGARLLLVRHDTGRNDVRSLIEGYILAAERPDVDILAAATGFAFAPDTSGAFAAVLFSRIVRTWGKPIFQSAGNTNQRLNSTKSLGLAFTVGGSLGPETFAAFFGGATLPGLMVHPTSAVGPSIDGGLDPDFLAPMHRLSARLWNQSQQVVVPKNAPARVLPRGYHISCCTSASGPYGAGVAALLLSASRQEGLAYSFDRLSRALRVGARFLQDWPAHQQGNGVLNVRAAWRELRQPVHAPSIRIETSVVHPLALYSSSQFKGQGIFEWEGWTAGMRGRRHLVLTRESGSKGDERYRVSWTGNDGTFHAPRAVVLPLRKSIPLPVEIVPGADGVHSAILNLHEPGTNAVIFRTAATIVAPERVDLKTMALTASGIVEVMRRRSHFVTVPVEVAAMVVELEVRRGSARLYMLPNHGLAPVQDTMPRPGRTFPQGRYTFAIPRPAQGTWTIAVDNTSARSEEDPALVSAEPVEYAMTISLLSAELSVRPSMAGAYVVDVRNTGAALREPVLRTSLGTLKRYAGKIQPSGLPNLYEFEVPAGAPTLAIDLRAVDRRSAGVELHLYDCTSGECFAQDFTLPYANAQRMIVAQPASGRWIAAVNAAPVPSADAAFELDVVVTHGTRLHSTMRGGGLGPGMRSTETIEPVLPSPSGAASILVVELLDVAIERTVAGLFYVHR